MSDTGKLPSIAELHTLEKEIHALLGSYKDAQKEYLDDIVKESSAVPYETLAQCFVKYGDKIVIAETAEKTQTSNCGWFGCRTAYMDDSEPSPWSSSRMKFDHGTSSPPYFYLRPKVGGSQKNGDRISYGDPVVLAQNADPGNTSNCGYYGCRVGYMTSDRRLGFRHGETNPSVFYLRPKVGSSKKNGQPVQYNDAFSFAESSQSGNTSNCGYYGCRVAKMIEKGPGESYLYFDHGKSKPPTFNLRRPNNYKQVKECGVPPVPTSTESEEKLAQLDDMNQSILSLVAKAKDKIAQLYHKGIKNQDKITLDNVKLNRIIQNMKKEDNKLNKLVRKLRSADGENKNASIQQNSAYYQYMVFAILSLVVLVLTIKTFMTQGSSFIETIILVIAGALILYHTGTLVF